MDVKKRSVAINEFKIPSRTPKVLVVSLKAGGVGLNVSVIYILFIVNLVMTDALAVD